MDTSKEANDFATQTGTKEAHKAKIMSVLNNKGAYCSSQIATLSGLRYDQVWRRMSDLKKEGKVVVVKAAIVHPHKTPVSIYAAL